MQTTDWTKLDERWLGPGMSFDGGDLLRVYPGPPLVLEYSVPIPPKNEQDDVGARQDRVRRQAIEELRAQLKAAGVHVPEEQSECALGGVSDATAMECSTARVPDSTTAPTVEEMAGREMSCTERSEASTVPPRKNFKKKKSPRRNATQMARARARDAERDARVMASVLPEWMRNEFEDLPKDD